MPAMQSGPQFALHAFQLSEAAMILTLPWPPKELSPNARVHFHVKARVTKDYRERAYWLAFKAVINQDCDFGPSPEVALLLDFTFHQPDKRRRDLDTMLSSVKAGIDGIADAIGVNDVRFEYALKRAEPVKGGKVVIVIGEGPDGIDKDEPATLD